MLCLLTYLSVKRSFLWSALIFLLFSIRVLIFTNDYITVYVWHQLSVLPLMCWMYRIAPLCRLVFSLFLWGFRIFSFWCICLFVVVLLSCQFCMAVFLQSLFVMSQGHIKTKTKSFHYCAASFKDKLCTHIIVTVTKFLFTVVEPKAQNRVGVYYDHVVFHYI